MCKWSCELRIKPGGNAIRLLVSGNTAEVMKGSGLRWWSGRGYATGRGGITPIVLSHGHSSRRDEEFAARKAAYFRSRSKFNNLEMESEMSIRTLSATLLAAGLVITVPALAQMSSVQKQKTQEGEVTTTGIQSDPKYKQPAQEGDVANPWQLADPKIKQRTQEGEITTTGIQSDPKYKQRAQDSANPWQLSDPKYKTPTQEGDVANPWQLADPKYKQRTQEGEVTTTGILSDPQYKQHTQNLTHTEPTRDVVGPK
jgi:hypothetical protein